MEYEIRKQIEKEEKSLTSLKRKARIVNVARKAITFLLPTTVAAATYGLTRYNHADYEPAIFTTIIMTLGSFPFVAAIHDLWGSGRNREILAKQSHLESMIEREKRLLNSLRLAREKSIFDTTSPNMADSYENLGKTEVAKALRQHIGNLSQGNDKKNILDNLESLAKERYSSETAQSFLPDFRRYREIGEEVLSFMNQYSREFSKMEKRIASGTISAQEASSTYKAYTDQLKCLLEKQSAFEITAIKEKKAFFEALSKLNCIYREDGSIKELTREEYTVLERASRALKTKGYLGRK